MSGAFDLIPHRAPFVLVDRVLSVTADTITVEKRISDGDPLVAGELTESLVLEALAQATACLNASGVRTGRRGYLVAASGFSFDGRPRSGDTLTLRVTRIAVLGALLKFDAEAKVGERVVAKGQLT